MKTWKLCKYMSLIIPVWDTETQMLVCMRVCYHRARVASCRSLVSWRWEQKRGVLPRSASWWFPRCWEESGCADHTGTQCCDYPVGRKIHQSATALKQLAGEENNTCSFWKPCVQAFKWMRHWYAPTTQTLFQVKYTPIGYGTPWCQWPLPMLEWGCVVAMRWCAWYAKVFGCCVLNWHES